MRLGLFLGPWLTIVFASATLRAQTPEPANHRWTFRTHALISGNSDRSDPAGYKVYSGIALDAGLSRAVNRFLAAELSLRTESREVDVANSPNPDIRLGSLELLPVSLLLQFYPPVHGGIHPYAGAGMNLTVGWEKTGALDSMDVPPSLGPALQLGVDFDLSSTMLLNADVKWNGLRTGIEDAGTRVATLTAAEATYTNRAPPLATIPKMGMIIPNMGMQASFAPTGLVDALFSPVQQRVLGLLFGQPERRFQSAELIRLARSGTGAVHRLLTRLADVGLVTVTRSGNQKHYQANRNCPVFAELHGLIVKTVGVVGPIQRALAPKAKKIHCAFVYGSVAKGNDKAGSDIDLMVITDALSYPDLFQALRSAEAVLARAVNPNVMSLAEWRTKRAQTGSFAARIEAGPRLFVIGSADDVG